MATPITDNLQSNSPKLLDNRSSNNGIPYISVAAANAATPLAFRARGLFKFIDNGSGLQRYVYKNGVTDSDLVKDNDGGTYVDVLVSSAELLDIYTTPKTIISTSNYVSVTKIVVFYTFVSTAYIGNTTLAFRYTGTNYNIATLDISSTVSYKITLPILSGSFENVDLELLAPVSNPTNGGGSLALRVYYTEENA